MRRPNDYDYTEFASWDYWVAFGIGATLAAWTVFYQWMTQ